MGYLRVLNNSKRSTKQDITHIHVVCEMVHFYWLLLWYYMQKFPRVCKCSGLIRAY